MISSRLSRRKCPTDFFYVRRFDSHAKYNANVRQTIARSGFSVLQLRNVNRYDKLETTLYLIVVLYQCFFKTKICDRLATSDASPARYISVVKKHFFTLMAYHCNFISNCQNGAIPVHKKCIS